MPSKIVSMIVLVTIAAMPGAAAPAQDAAASEAVGKRVVYKTSAGKERHMEIFSPPDHDPARSKVPGLILFHGGGWSGGTLAQFRVACDHFAKRGLVCATAEYQMLGKKSKELPPHTSFKRVCVTDAKSAIRWFKAHAPELGIDPARIIAGGGSAGGHVSALATMNPGLNDPADPEGVDTSVIAYLWFNPAFAPDDRGDPEIDVARHLKKDLPPAIVFYGDDDPWKPGWDAVHTKWNDVVAAPIDLRIARGQPHGFFNKEPWRSATLLAADEFLVAQGLLPATPAKSPEPTVTLEKVAVPRPSDRP